MGKIRKTVEPAESEPRPSPTSRTPYRPPVRIPSPDGELPALPAALAPARRPQPPPWPQPPFWPWPTATPQAPRDQARSLRHGCYLLRYTPVSGDVPLHQLHYDGTLRVERNGSSTTASGDLYLHRPPVFVPGGVNTPGLGEPDPGSGIPIFPRADYRYYVRVTTILEDGTTADAFTLGFELHRFEAATNGWVSEGAFTARMAWTTAPSGYPSPDDYLSGEVTDPAGTVVGTITTGWVSKYLRKALIEIDRVAESEPPLDNGAGVNWRTVFDQIGWDMTVVQSNSDVDEPSGDSWSDAEMHAAMLDRRDSADLDREWRYHILCVRNIDSTPRGIMYDAYSTDSNSVPREGIGIATHWVIPDEDPWGRVKGVRFGAAAAPYFRTALHEIGHAMGLYHNTVDNGVMNTTDVIAESATPPVQFPDNIQWLHAPDDRKRLRHFPDIWVRPGGTPFGLNYNSAPISPDDLIAPATGLVLEVAPLLDSVPIGAPVRIDVALVNTTKRPLPVPHSLSLKAGHVSGKVVDPSGTVRTFSPLVLCLDEESTRPLDPGDRLTDSMTLLRGRQGALFPTPGVYRVSVDLDWEIGGVQLGVTGETTVMVGPAEDKAHADAALQVLSTPDAHLTLVLGGDHLPEGVKAIQAAVKNPVLRPHYAMAEARRVGYEFQGRKTDIKTVADLIDEDAVLSAAEVKRAAQMVKKCDAPAQTVKKIAKVLKEKAEKTDAPADVVTLVESL
jgi:hypothetical protein